MLEHISQGRSLSAHVLNVGNLAQARDCTKRNKVGRFGDEDSEHALLTIRPLPFVLCFLNEHLVKQRFDVGLVLRYSLTAGNLPSEIEITYRQP